MFVYAMHITKACVLLSLNLTEMLFLISFDGGATGFSDLYHCSISRFRALVHMCINIDTMRVFKYKNS